MTEVTSHYLIDPNVPINPASDLDYTQISLEGILNLVKVLPNLEKIVLGHYNSTINTQHASLASYNLLFNRNIEVVIRT